MSSFTPEHYKVGDGKLEHRHYVGAVNAPYYESCASKYLLRWRDKNGVADLEKAKHFVEYRLEMLVYGAGPLRGSVKNEDLFNYFVRDNELGDDETDLINRILHWLDYSDLRDTYDALCAFIKNMAEEEKIMQPTIRYVNQG